MNGLLEPGIVVESRRAAGRLRRLYGDSAVFDLTSKGPEPWLRFSPFFPHGDIPVPFWPGMSASSVEGIWQGLKRFEFEDEVDVTKFSITTMRDIKRSSRGRGRKGVPRGRVLGHQLGARSLLLDYKTARVTLYLPSYRWVLEHRLQRETAALREASRHARIFLLDYSTNGELFDTSRPLSHAALVRRYVLDSWPTDQIDVETLRDSRPQ
jgi:hypothetical protein